MQPNYIISQSSNKVVLRNFEGVITSYPEPQNYQSGSAEEFYKKVYPEVFEKFESNGVLSIIDDTKFNLTPEGLNRLDRRKTYDQNPEHSSLKDKREKRDQLKEKKFETQMKKYETAGAKEE